MSSDVLKQQAAEEMGTSAFNVSPPVGKLENTNLPTLSSTARTPRDSYYAIRAVL